MRGKEMRMRIRPSSATADLESTDRPLGGRRTAASHKFFTILQVAELLEVSTRGSSGRRVDREAQTSPRRPIHIIVGFAAAGTGGSMRCPTSRPPIKPHPRSYIADGFRPMSTRSCTRQRGSVPNPQNKSSSDRSVSGSTTLCCSWPTLGCDLMRHCDLNIAM